MIVRFTDATLATGGGKAANLGELQRAGLPVPDGFVVTADAYRDAIAGLGLSALLRDEGPGAVRAAIEALPVPEELADTIAAGVAAWGSDVPVAVRSSATAEDLPEASFAGQQDTFLGVVGVAAITDAVRRCWASLWTDRAVDYRRRNGFAHHEVALAVVVQRLVDADTAGVLFTRDPVTGAAQMLVDASWGLGESVVSGTVTPDQFRTTPAEVLERRVGAKETRIDRHGTATRTTVTPAADRERLCLTDAQVLDLARVGKAIEEHFGAGMDVEWAFADGALWVLQARPITTAPGREGAEGADCAEGAAAPAHEPPTTTVTGRRIGTAARVFHTDLIEHYPGPFPLDLAAILPMHRQLQEGMASIGIRATPVDQLVAMAPDGTITAAYPDVRIGPRIARLLHFPAPDPARWPDVEAAYRRRLAAALPADLTAVPAERLLPLLGGVLRIVDDIARVRFLDYVGPAQLTGIRLGAYLRLARRPDLDAYDLLGDLDHTTAVIDRALRRLAALDPDDPAFDEARQRFLDEHGARTAQMYLPFSHRSWREDPAALDATLAAVRRGQAESSGGAGDAEGDAGAGSGAHPNAGDGADPHAGADASPAARRTPHRELVAQLTRRLPAPARRGFALTVARWRSGHLAREASVYLLEEAYVQARRVTDEIARRLHARRALPDAEHLRYLTLEEIAEALGGTLAADDARLRVTERAAARPRAAAAWWVRSESSEAEALTGAPGSPGLAAGPARIITGPDEFDRLQPGDILVCPYTDPTWTPLFGLAAGVVAETGGRLSHAAIVAREYGIPAVMGAQGATTALTDGQMVTVDGTAGTVAMTAGSAGSAGSTGSAGRSASPRR